MAELNEDQTKRMILNCRDEAEEAKRTRMALNKNNYEMYQLRHDFSHKREGQSTEILSKQRMAVEQIKSFFQQALVDVGEWWQAVAKDGTEGEGMLIKPHEIEKLTNYMLRKANYFSHVGNAIQSALLGSLAVAKVHGCMKSKPKFRTRKEGRGKNYRKYVETIDDKSWELKFDIIRQENYYPDPSGQGIYEIEDCWLDMHIVRRLAEGDEAIFDRAAVAKLQPWTPDAELQDYKRAREVGQDTPHAAPRPQVKITEFWGTLVDRVSGDIMYENCLITLANDTHIIRKPTPNPLWHQRVPIIAAPLIEVANSVWHVALMDAPTMHNRTLIELYNLLLDAAMKTVHGISQIKVDKLQNPAQVSDGIKWGTTLQANSALQPGEKVMEPVVTGEIPREALEMSNLIQQEFNSSALTNDLRQGVMPFRAVKATEVVEASNTITSVFQGVAKNVEMHLIQPELEMSWMTIAQNLDRIDKEELVSLFGQERGEQISQMDPQDVFVETVNGVRFDVFGISLTLGKAADFKKLTTLLQTIGGSEVLIEEFVKRYDFGKLLGEIMVALNIDKNKIAVGEGMEALNAGSPDAMAQPGAAPGAGGAASEMSRVGGAGTGSLADIFGQPNFSQQSLPGSPATAGS